MHIISIILSLFITVIQPSTFICDGDPLEAKIINNQNGNFDIVNDISRIDLGAFVVLKWRVNLMLPRTFINGETSFSDNKWKWIYQESDTPRLLQTKQSGQIIEYDCE